MSQQESEADEEETYTREEIRAALAQASKEASNHGANYAAGMRLSRSIIEGELFGSGEDSTSE